MVGIWYWKSLPTPFPHHHFLCNDWKYRKLSNQVSLRPTYHWSPCWGSLPHPGLSQDLDATSLHILNLRPSWHCESSLIFTKGKETFLFFWELPPSLSLLPESLLPLVLSPRQSFAPTLAPVLAHTATVCKLGKGALTPGTTPTLGRLSEDCLTPSWMGV